MRGSRYLWPGEPASFILPHPSISHQCQLVAIQQYNCNNMQSLTSTYWSSGPNKCTVDFYDLPCAKMAYNVDMTSLPFSSTLSSDRDAGCLPPSGHQGGDTGGLYHLPPSSSSSYCHPSSQMQLSGDAALRYISIQDAAASASDYGLSDAKDKRPQRADGTVSCDTPLLTESNSARRSVMATARERHRTMNVNAAFSILRTLIPTEPADRRLSKIETLRLAASYISHLHAALTADVRCDQQPCHATRRAVTSSCDVMRVEQQQQGAVICTFCLSAAKARVSVLASKR